MDNIDGMVYFILFDGTEQSCWAYLCTFQPRAQYGRLPKLRETVDKIYDSRPSLAALLSSAHRISARFTVSSCVHSQGLYSLYSASVVLLINYLRLHRELLTLGYSSLFVCLFVCLFPRLCYSDLRHFWVGDLQRLAGNIDCQRPILQTDKYFSFTSGQLISTGDFHRYPNREYLAV